MGHKIDPELMQCLERMERGWAARHSEVSAPPSPRRRLERRQPPKARAADPR